MTKPEDFHYSGVLVLTRPERLESCAAEVGAIPGVDVYLRDEKAGRLIAVLESDDTEGQEVLLGRVRAVPGVLSAALVYHFVDSDASGMDAATGRMS